MGYLILSVAVCICLALAFRRYCYADKINTKVYNAKLNKSHLIMCLLSAIALLVRVTVSAMYRGHDTDMNCFTGWSSMIFNDGISSFYTSDTFHDYPPGYMYVLYVIGAIKSFFGPTDGMLWLLVKSPAIIADILCAILVYKITLETGSAKTPGAIISALYLFNPATIINSSFWGQVDSVYTLFILLMIYMLSNRKLIKSYFVFALCIFIKPQAFMFFPLILFGIIENVFSDGFNIKIFFKNLLYGLCAILMIVILSMPFGIKNVVEQYISTLSSYPYLTVNAFNVWGALGLNWVAITPVISVVTYIILGLIVVYCAYVFFKTRKQSKYYYVGALLSFLTFMLSTKMHDRYAYTAMILMLAAFIYNKDVKSYILYIAFTVSQFFNTAWVLFIYNQDINKFYRSITVNIASVINVIMLVAVIIYTNRYYCNNKAFDTVFTKKKKNHNNYKITKSAKLKRLSRGDFMVIISIMIIYSLIAFYNLGDTISPQTGTQITNDTVTVDLGDEENVSEIKMFLGHINIDEQNTIEITYLDKNKIITGNQTINNGNVFKWNEISANKKAQYITLCAPSKSIYINELCLIGASEKIITPINSRATGISNMFDEQGLLPEHISYKNGTYFDEIYHARTAYEFIHKLDVYEWTHPPLGKTLISIGIRIFGMTPFGYRFVGTLFGVLMIPIIYIFAQKLLKLRWLSCITCLLLTFDFMHFSQTRIATIDVYVTFFIMLMYLFMFKYYSLSFYDTPLKKTLVPLGFCGISMGLGIAAKWQGIYAGVGLAIIFFIVLFKRYKEYLFASQNPDDETDGISHRYVINSFKKNTAITVIFCCVFFVLVPLLIYILSYIPYLASKGEFSLKAIWENQISMYTYHGETVVNSTHPYSSKWYEWLTMKRPILYYTGTINNNIKEGISSFGNPLVWWTGIAAFIYMIYRLIAKKDKISLFLVTAYLAHLLPWVFVTRTTYIYHYFPSVPFVVLMIGYTIYNLYNNADTPNKKILCKTSSYAYIVLTILLFLMFYPVLSGYPCDEGYVNLFLKWFNTWVLII